VDVEISSFTVKTKPRNAQPLLEVDFGKAHAKPKARAKSSQRSGNVIIDFVLILFSNEGPQTSTRLITPAGSARIVEHRVILR
jgi:hypothetical protein